MAMSVYLDIDQGSDFTKEILIKNDNNAPMNLSGYKAYSQFRKSYNSSTAYNFVTSMHKSAQGKIILSLSGLVSSNIKCGRYIYDIEIVSSDGCSTLRVVEGVLAINPEITKIPKTKCVSSKRVRMFALMGV